MHKRCRRVAVEVGGLLLLASPLSHGADATAKEATASQVEAREQVLKLERDWTAAEGRHDEAALRRILDDKFLATFGTKPPEDKESFIKSETAGEIDPTASQNLSDQTVIVDGDTAVVIGTDTMRASRNGAAHTLVARYTATYIRRDGRWVALAEHMVKVPDAKP